MSEGPFKIGVLGETSIMPELQQMARTKRAGSQPIKIVQYFVPSEIDSCHILYLGDKDSPMFADALLKIKNSNTLLVTERKGLAKKGAAISFVVIENKQKFELNKKNLEKSGLQVNSALLSLAIIIE